MPVDRPGRALVAALERELALLARHHLHPGQRGQDRTLDRSGYHLLGRLEHGPMSMKQLSEAFQLDPSTVNRQVGALLKAGLVERVKDPDGGAARLLRPTARGLELLRHDRRVNQDSVAKVVAGWPVDDVERLKQLLERFNTSIEELEGRPWPRNH